MNIVFRADASTNMGSGHVMRCLTLAEALREKVASVKFVSRNHAGNLNLLISQKRFSVSELARSCHEKALSERDDNVKDNYRAWLGVSENQDALDTIKAIGPQKTDWLIVDHYALGEKWERRLRPYVNYIMVIDDLANRRHKCDILLDQNWFEDLESRYDGLLPAACTKLLGPRYALLRQEFLEARKTVKPKTGKVERIFVFFGASDPDNLTGNTLRALSHPELLHLEADVVIGVNNPHQNDIKKLVKNRPKTHLHIQIDNIASIMANADLAIGSGGINTWERMASGLPSITVITAANQRIISEELDKNQLTNLIGDKSPIDINLIVETLHKITNDPEKLIWQIDQVKDIVNVYGSKLVTEWLIGTISEEDWTVREAVESDTLLYWEWANNQDVRKNALNKERIHLSTHKKWFSNKINNKNSVLCIIEVGNNPIGQVRFDIEEDFARIDYSIGKQFRGRRLGKKLLEMAVEKFHSIYSIKVAGEVLPENIASIKTFESLGFKKSILNNNVFFTKEFDNLIQSNA